MQKEVAKISNGLNVCLCCEERGGHGGATSDHTCIALSGGISRNIMLPRRRGGFGGMVVTVFFLFFFFSDLCANLIILFSL